MSNVLEYGVSPQKTIVKPSPPDGYLEHSRISTLELSAKIINGKKLLFSQKSSIVDAGLGSKYASALPLRTCYYKRL